ncbi:MAG TPA: TetR/AcrR family transcriptional regulator [Bryobacteraceae bacterium]|nr:TetR/AcrR family transcriptional regulator [Bryobacteraceae bacterium]HTF72545.1 TetR/AcrR family transcriptional regulator [Edaphobacter sp.]
MRQQAKATTRDRILESGLNLLSTSGFAGVTLGVLAGQVGMSKSGLFAHFKSKEEVEIELLDQMAGVVANHVLIPAMRAPEGLPRLEAAVHNWFGWSTKAGLPGGCPAAAGMFELDDVEGPVRDKLFTLEQQLWGQFKQLALDAIAQGHLRRDLDVDQFIWELGGIYLNHHASLRFMRDRQANARAEQAFQGLIERAAPVAAKRSSGSRSTSKRK